MPRDIHHSYHSRLGEKNEAHATPRAPDMSMGNEANYIKTPSTSVEASPKVELEETNTSEATSAETTATTLDAWKPEARIKTEEEITK